MDIRRGYLKFVHECTFEFSRALVDSVMNLRVPSNAGNFLTKDLLGSQIGLCSMELVS